MESIELFFQFLKQKAERGKWSFLLTLNGALAGMVSFLIGSFLSFYRTHVRSLHWVCRIVPKTLNPRWHEPIVPSFASTFASRQSNNIFLFFLLCLNLLREIEWCKMEGNGAWLEDIMIGWWATFTAGRNGEIFRREKKYWICFRT